MKNTNPNFQHLAFAGGLYDQDTKFLRFGARDYDPTIGRWTTKDPLGFDGGDTNMYAYVGGSPMSAIDPEGKFALALPLIVPVIVNAVVVVSATYAGWKVSNLINTLMSKRTKNEKKEKDIVGGHDKNKRPSTKEKHERADTRRKRDQCGEKGDARRPYQR